MLKPKNTFAEVSMHLDNEKKLLYVYCISRNTSSLRSLELCGIDSRPVLFLQHGDLAVAFSEVPWRVATLNKEVRETSWVAKRVREHECVVEEVMQKQAILPVKFLTLFKSQKSLLEGLNPHLTELDNYLEDMKDKQEWALKVYCNKSQSLKHLLKTETLPEKMLHKKLSTPGAQYLQTKRIEESAKERLESNLCGFIQEVCEALTPFSVERVILKVHDKKITQRIEDMLLNGAFLVTKRMLKAFKGKVKDLKENYRPWGFLFELTGPWPPYNFCPNLVESTQGKATI